MMYIKAQETAEILELINQPFQEQIAFTIDTMFDGQDTIFTETDSFIFFTTPDMVIPELDTLAYRYHEDSELLQAWDFNKDEIRDFIGIVNIFDTKSEKYIDMEAPQNLFIAQGTEEGFEIVYFEPIIACQACGIEGGMPDISILTKENVVEVVEVQGDDEFIYNDEYKMSFEAGYLFVNKHIHASYHMRSENLYTKEVDLKTMMQVDTYEPDEGDDQKFRKAILTAEKAKEISIDGELNESIWNSNKKFNWRPLHATIMGDKHTRNDLFGKYSVTWDDENLYFALKVIDDKLVPISEDPSNLSGDYVKIELDFSNQILNDGKLINNMSDYYYAFYVGFDKYGTPAFYSSLELENAFPCSFARTNNGYNAEIQINTNTLLEDDIQAGQEINVTVSIADSDYIETGEIQNIDASASRDETTPFKMSKVILYDEFKTITFENYKK